MPKFVSKSLRGSTDVQEYPLMSKNVHNCPMVSTSVRDCPISLKHGLKFELTDGWVGGWGGLG